MKKITAHTLILWISCLGVLALYFGLLLAFGSNNPQSDEFFDALAFLEMYQQRITASDKVALFFWQYTEHIQVFSKLIWLVYYTLFEKLNFFPILILGAILLPATAYLTSHIFSKQSDCNSCNILISLLIILCPSIWLHHMVAGYTTLAFTPIFFSVLLLYLLYKQQIAWAAFVLLFPAFTLAAGVFMVVISAVYIWTIQEVPYIKKLLFSTLASIILYFFLDIHMALEPFGLHKISDYIVFAIQKPGTMILGFFGFVGSLSFMEDDPFWPAILCGILLVALALGLLIYLFKNNLRDFLTTGALLLFFSLCLASVTLTRVSTYDLSPINNYHYKLYSLPLWAITITGIYNHSTSKNIRGLLIFFAVAIFTVGYLRYLQPISEDSRAKREMMTEWAITGKQQALGYTVMLPYSHEALLNSIKKGYYSPFDSQRGVMDQPKSIKKTTLCTAPESLSLSKAATITTNDDSIAFAVTPNYVDTPIKQVALCGNQHHFLFESSNSKRRMGIDKSNLPPDQYRILIKDSDHRWSILSSTLSITGQVPHPPCNMDYPGYRQLIVAPTIYNLLCPQAPLEPFDRKPQ